MLIVGGAANCLYGVTGLVKEDHFVSDALLFGAVEFWGGVNLIIGAIYFLVALLLVRGVASGSFLGMILAGVNAMAQMLAIGAYPIWSVIVLVVDGLIIYALAMHGSSLANGAETNQRPPRETD